MNGVGFLRVNGIRKVDGKYVVLGGNGEFDEYDCGDVGDMCLFVDYLLDELAKSEEKYGMLFDKYWENVKRLNTVKDVVNHD